MQCSRISCKSDDLAAHYHDLGECGINLTVFTTRPRNCPVSGHVSAMVLLRTACLWYKCDTEVRDRLILLLLCAPMRTWRLRFAIIADTKHRRFFQSQGSDEYLLIHSYRPNLTVSKGLFSAPTRIMFIVAPTNIVLNYILGTFRLRSTVFTISVLRASFTDILVHHLLIEFFLFSWSIPVIHSMGTRLDTTRIYRSPDCNSYLYESDHGLLLYIRSRVRTKDGMASFYPRMFPQSRVLV
jgi:hypothetical protein